MKEPRRLQHLRQELGGDLASALDPSAVEPSPLELQELTTKLGSALCVPLTPPAVPPAATATAMGNSAALASASKLLPAWKLAAWVLGGVALGAGLSGAVASALSTSDNPAPAASSTTSVPVPSVMEPPAAPTQQPAPGALLARAERTGSVPSVMTRKAPSPNAAEPSDEPAPPTLDELSILKQAQESLRSNPARALSLSVRHQLEFPQGGLAQEREVIAIEALINLGRGAEARARAAHFESQYPGSAHAPRLEQLLTDAAGR